MITSINGILASGSSGVSSLMTGIYSSYILDADLNDSLGNYNGTIAGTETYTTGKINNGLSLNGSSYFALGTDTHKFASDFSFTFWVKLSSLATTCYPVSNYQTPGVQRGWRISIAPTGVVSFVGYSGGTNILSMSSASSTITTGVWYNITVNFVASGSCAIYVNGLSVATGSASGACSYTTSTYPTVGASKYTSVLVEGQVNGVMDAVTFWSRSITYLETWELYNSSTGKQYPYSYVSMDSDAQAFITATGITDATQKGAINLLVLDNKVYGTWSKINALYPFVGGNATAHSYNLRNTANYQLTFFGGGTHSSLGYVGNGTSGYAKTGIIPNDIVTQNNIHLSYYSQTDTTSSSTDMGVYQASKAPSEIFMRYNSTTSLAYLNASTGSVTVSGGKRYMVASRQSSSVVSVTNNGVTSSISSNSIANPSTIEMYIHSVNLNGAPSTYSARTISTITVGQTLTDTEAQNMSNAVNAFNTALGRNIY